ncbi:Rv3235 family protein [Microbacterium sp. CnD16-F]|uniref:3-hydroxyacyl-CoA dehydrogenase n=1 Tax=Microbacterium oleivorans TaxID=273677 RepID=A0A177KE93_9MICO|nr:MULTISPECIES: Rv3235 family protein [Microbacterium]MCO7204191.1 Rv3235 family protein [Microbacterium sp. CnD16-F]MDT0179714.1 Rv3235 family protein [Microbacterium sp. ARD31]OAH50901.1 3-hydroxyacyl-CoA dehydrogenase [Microbacterium oleivorans]
MALTATEDSRIPRSGSALEVAEYFAPQRTSTADLPDPLPLVKNLTIGVLEVLAGVRDVDQLARWLGEDAYRALVTRANLSARARSARGVAAVRPAHRILSDRTCEPADGVLEAVVVVGGPIRTRAVAMRLEGWDGRWRATSLALL